MKDEFLITLDVDWASDAIIAKVKEQLVKNRVKATWFVTHDSPEIRNLQEYPFFELGIHPNFDVKSTQGNNPDEVMRFVKKIVPDAKSVRTHALIQSSALLKLMREKFGIIHDVSI